MATGAAIGTETLFDKYDDVVDVIDTVFGDKFDLPWIQYTPYAIFANQVPLFDINFFDINARVNRYKEELEKFKEYKISDSDLYEQMGGDKRVESLEELIDQGSLGSSASILQKTVSEWYQKFRLIAIVMMLSILVYIGIRIMISSSATSKAKYKELIKDWIVAMCLLFTMHYIMAFIISTCELITKQVSLTCTDYVMVKVPTNTEVYSKSDNEWYGIEEDEDGNTRVALTYMGAIRYLAAYSEDALQQIAFLIFYIVLIIYVCVFSVMYIKRVLYMAFLTMIAPLVAMTYPLDKIHDGRAQGFSTWLKEYIFNALIQPVHLLLYAMIMGTVMDLAIEHPFYAMIALGFMIPAESFVRKLFGFDKASTSAGMSMMGAAGAGVVMSGINKMIHRPMSRDNNTNKEQMEGGKNSKIKFKPFENNMIDSNSSKNASLESNVPLGLVNSIPKRIGGGVARMASQERAIKDEGDGIINQPKKQISSKLSSGLNAVGKRFAGKIHPLKMSRRALGYAMGAATVGTIGLAAGISTGDLNKTIQYTAAAGHIGGNFGKGISEDIANEGSEVVKAFKTGYNGTENNDNMQELNSEELLMAYKDYAEQGCKDINRFHAAYQLEMSGVSRDEALYDYKLASKTGDIYRNQDSEEMWRKTLEEEYLKNDAIKSQYEKEAEKIEEEFEKERLDTEEQYKKELRQAIKETNKEKMKELRQENKKRLKEIEYSKDKKIKQVKKDVVEPLVDRTINNIKFYYKNL